MNEQKADSMLCMTSEEHKYLEERFRPGDEKGAVGIDADAFLKGRQIITVRVQDPYMEIPLHKHNYIEMMYLDQGQITHFINGTELTMNPGDLLLMNQYAEHRELQRKSRDRGMVFIIRPVFFDIPLQMLPDGSEIRNFLVNCMCRNNPCPQYLLFRSGGRNDIRNLMENLIEVIVGDNGNGGLISQYTVGLVFLYLSGMTERVQDLSQGHRDMLVREVLKYIEVQYKTAMLSRIAEELHQSVSGLSKMIKQETGCTFQELLMKKRFQKAARLLTETNLQVEEIAVNVGYENLSYFYRQFKKQYKMTPRQYRVVNRRSSWQKRYE